MEKQPEIVTVGRIVHYVNDRGNHLAAIVTGTGYGGIEDTCSVTAFPLPPGEPYPRAYVPFDPTGKIFHSYHWPERDNGLRQAAPQGLEIDYSVKLPGE